VATFEERLGEAKTKLEELNKLKIQTETQLAEYEKQKAVIIADMKKLGFTPENIEAAIKQAEAALEKDLTALEKQLETANKALEALKE